MIVRENTEGLYSGIEDQTPDRATTLRVVSRKGTERIIRKAIELARQRNGLLTIGHKANVIKSDVFFRDICLAEAKAAGISCNDKFIDALSLDILQHPEKYSVVVTSNMFGDILSDVTAYLVGGLGLLPSGNIGMDHSLFEPVHGSAPDIAGRNIANPIAALRSAAMLLHHIGEHASCGLVEQAIRHTIERGIITRDLGGTAGTSEFAESVLSNLKTLIQRC